MSIEFRIVPEFGLVCMRYTGRFSAHESLGALARFMAHPDYRPGLRQLVDLSGVTTWSRDFFGVMRMTAGMVALIDPEKAFMSVCYAPTPVSQELADKVFRAWDRLDGVAFRAVDTEAAALRLLGLEGTSIDALLAHT